MFIMVSEYSFNPASGKNSAVNMILGREEPHMYQRTLRHIKGEGCVAGREITLVDTPGWWSNSQLVNIPEDIQKETVYSVFTVRAQKLEYC